MRIFFSAGALAFSLGVAAQPAPADSDTAGTTSGLGARNGPSDGAIQGGSIAPGEHGGAPNGAAGQGKARSDTAERRCYELSGVLRQQCLQDQASGGSTRAPQRNGAGPGGPDPRTAPPPQNPLGR